MIDEPVSQNRNSIWVCPETGKPRFTYHCLVETPEYFRRIAITDELQQVTVGIDGPLFDFRALKAFSSRFGILIYDAEPLVFGRDGISLEDWKEIR